MKLWIMCIALKSMSQSGIYTVAQYETQWVVDVMSLGLRNFHPPSIPCTSKPVQTVGEFTIDQNQYT